MDFNVGNTAENAGKNYSEMLKKYEVDPRGKFQANLNSQVSFLPNITSSEILHLPQNDWTKTIPHTMPWLNGNNSFQGFGISHHQGLCSPNTLRLNNPSRLFSSPNTGRQYFSKKRSLDMDEGPKQKQRMMEAKFAKSFDSLHISDDYSVPVVNSDSQGKQAKMCTFEELEASIQDEDEETFSKNTTEPSLEFSKEMKNICKYSVPEYTLRNRASKAVVLWKPPGGIINELLRFSKSDSAEDSPEENGDKKKQDEANADIRADIDLPCDIEAMDF